MQPKPLIRTNDAELIHGSVLADLGIAYAPQWMFIGDLKTRGPAADSERI